MSLSCRVGASLETINPGLILSVSTLYDEGLIDHLQIVVIPQEEPGIFRTICNLLASLEVPVLIHAPYHRHGVNLCAPYAFSPKPPEEVRQHIEHAMMQTRELADLVSSPCIVLHAGMYKEGRRDKAIEGFHQSLDEFYDARMILENLPALFGGMMMLGTTYDELRSIGNGRINGFCLDFAHLYCTSNYQGSDYASDIGKFSTSDLRLLHLSSSREGSVRDEHLPLNHPVAGLPMHPVVEFIRAHRRIPISLEYRQDAAFYREQIGVFKRYFRSVE